VRIRIRERIKTASFLSANPLLTCGARWKTLSIGSVARQWLDNRAVTCLPHKGLMMPPKILLDLSTLDLEKVLYDRKQIEEVNPHRFEMQHLDGIIHLDAERVLMVGYKDVTDKEFWIRGHIPDRPIMPGIIMIEAAAQLLSFSVNKIYGDQRFIGFGGIDRAKFRGTVSPGNRLILVGKMIDRRSRRYVCDCQGFVNEQMVFEVCITGMAV